MGKLLFSVCQSTSRREGWEGGVTHILPIRGGTPILPNQGGRYSHPSQLRRGVPSSQVRMGGVIPHPRSGHGVSLSQIWAMGYPHPRSWDTPIPGWGYYPDQVPGQEGGTPNWNSIGCTCYTAGGMPLAFTQEDFLFIFNFTNVSLHDHFQSFVVTFSASLQVPNRSLRLH